MATIIMSINAGSSSVKVSVYDLEKDLLPRQVAEMQITGLTSTMRQYTYIRGSENIAMNKEIDPKVQTQDEAFKFLLAQLVYDKQLSQISKTEDIGYACHRVAHGGDYQESKIINADTYHHIEALMDLAPLHNASALEIIKSCVKELPKTRNIAYFDTQFHRLLPERIRMYAINPEIAKKKKLRKYGFHGISFAFISRSVAEYLGQKECETSIIALHIGSGASACAIRNGISIDTSMGLTPVDGLPGATRSGSIDPSLVFHYASDVGKLSQPSSKGLHISKAEAILNNQSGWKALTGTADFQTIDSSSDPRMLLAFDILVDRICGYVGSYYVTLEGKVDALVFAGGIGEKSQELRKKVMEKCACLGFAVEAELNETVIEGIVQEVGAKTARHKTLVCKTNEQLEMARCCSMDKRLFRFRNGVPPRYLASDYKVEFSDSSGKYALDVPRALGILEL